MAYQVLARKYRPQRFADVAGQDHVTVTLMNALTQQRIAHGYIFSGHRGIGKTTIARILAMALNCRTAIGSEQRPTAEPCEVCDSCTEIKAGNAVDVIEIDAATNRGIDDIRELRDAARYRPARDKYKIYLLDEAHQITDAAFNALLKTLEEPPDHIVFMMATTQPEDIPQTVRSRCQHFSFHAVKLVDILAELRGIATKEGIDADDAALALLAEAGDGSMRDALSIMDQAIASAPTHEGRAVLDASQIRELMGTVPNAVFERILIAVDANQSAEVMTVSNQLLDSGNSPAQLARQCCRYLRNALIARIAGVQPDGTTSNANATELLQISPDEQRRAARTAALFTEEELTRFLQIMLRTFDELGYRQEQRFHFELGLLKLVHLRRLLPVEELLSAMPVSATAVPKATPRPTPPPKPEPPVEAPSRLPSVEPHEVPGSSPGNQIKHEPAKPAFSPFEQSSGRKRFDDPPAPVAKPAAPIDVYAAASVPTRPLPQEVKLPEPVTVPAELPTPEPVFESAPPPPAVLPTLMGAVAAEPAALQQAAVEALTSAKGQQSAADALDESTFTLDLNTLTIQTGVSKTMLGIVVNAEAEKLVRATLPAGMKLVVLPGAALATEKKVRPARAGSAQARASAHPIVQQAQSLFNAEIRTVIDLREGE